MKDFDELIEKWGEKAVALEQYIYAAARHFSPDYNGGYWQSKQLEGDERGFYWHLDTDTSYSIVNTANYYDSGDMDSVTFGLSIFSMVCNIEGNRAYIDRDFEYADDLFALFKYCQMNAMEILKDDKKHSQYHWFLD